MKNSNLKIIRRVPKELQDKIYNFQGTLLFRYDIVAYYLVDKTIVKSWDDGYGSTHYSEVPLDYYRQIVIEFRQYLDTTLRKIYDRNDTERKIGNAIISQSKEQLANAKKLIRPIEKEIMEREFNRSVNESKGKMEALIKELSSVVNNLNSMGLNEQLTITHNGEVVFDTSQEMRL